MPTKKPSPAVTPQSEAEALVVQHALAFYRDMKHHAKNAPFGEFLHYAEAVAIAQGREFIQTSLQTLAQEEVNEVEKKTKRDSVEPAKRKRGS
jgi:hypothetical protein